MPEPDPFAPAWRFLWWDEDTERDRRRENPKALADPIFDPVPLEEPAARPRNDDRWRPWGERWAAGEEDESW